MKESSPRKESPQKFDKESFNSDEEANQQNVNSILKKNSADSDEEDDDFNRTRPKKRVSFSEELLFKNGMVLNSFRLKTSLI